jgi:peroxiredoxin
MRSRLSLLAVFVACACAAPGRAPAEGTFRARPGEAGEAPPLPSETVVTLDGQRTPIGGVLKGRVALVTLWATWCDACVREIDALNRLAVSSAGRGDALVVGIAVGEPHTKVDRFVRERGLRYAQLVDEDFRLADALGQRDVPATLVVDRTGRVVFRGEALDRAGLAAFRAALGPEAPEADAPALH